MVFNMNIIHHAGLITKNLHNVISKYELLGFNFTPLSLVKITIKLGEPPVYIGLGNRTAIFRKNYLEVVGMPDPDIWAGFPVEKRGMFNIDERLPLYAGLHIMHFGTDDIEAVREGYLAQGRAAPEIARLQRMVDTAEGERLMQAKVLAFPKDANPEGLIQVAQHVTPELVLQPRYMSHPNGAIGLSEVIVTSRTPDVVAAKYAGYSGHAVERIGSAHVVDLGLTRIIVVDAAGLDERVPGYAPHAPESLAGVAIEVADLAATRAYLGSVGIKAMEVGDRLIVAPKKACGSALIFEAERLFV